MLHFETYLKQKRNYFETVLLHFLFQVEIFLYKTNDMSDDLKRISEHLKKHIEDNGYNKEDISARLGVSRVSLYRYLNQGFSNMSKARELAYILGVDLQEELNIVSEPTPIYGKQSDNIWKTKYYEAMEKYSLVMEQREEYRTKAEKLEEELEQLKSQIKTK